MALELTKRSAINSQDYATKLSGMSKLTSGQKASRLEAILADKQNAMQRIGQGMIGPIQIRLRYEGIVRNVLVEDTLERGPLMPYDILDDLGMAYVINSTDSEVKVQVFEGKQAFPNLFRIASQPRVRKEDLYFLRVNAVEYAQDESRQAIQKAEDQRLVLLLESSIVDFGNFGPPPVGGTQTGISAGPAGHTNEKTILIGAGNPLEPQDFYSAITMIEIEQLEAKRILMHPQDIRDLYTWDFHQTSLEWRNKVVGGESIASFGEFTIQKSVIVPQGEIFLTAEPNFVGVFPVMYSLDVEENHQVEQFYKGWVMDELVGMLVLNARGIARILKADSYATSGVVTDISQRGLYV